MLMLAAGCTNADFANSGQQENSFTAAGKTDPEYEIKIQKFDVDI